MLLTKLLGKSVTTRKLVVSLVISAILSLSTAEILAYLKITSSFDLWYCIILFGIPCSLLLEYSSKRHEKYLLYRIYCEVYNEGSIDIIELGIISISTEGSVILCSKRINPQCQVNQIQLAKFINNHYELINLSNIVLLKDFTANNYDDINSQLNNIYKPLKQAIKNNIRLFQNSPLENYQHKIKYHSKLFGLFKPSK